MKKKKIVILIGLLFLCSACSAEVNLEITDKNVNEEILINANTDETVTKEVLKGNFRKYIPAYNDVIVPDTEPDVKLDGVKYYTQKETEIENGYVYNYSYSFPISDYNNARSLKKVFKSSSLEKDNKEKTLTLYTDNNGILLMNDFNNFTDLRVNIKTDYEVMENNADSVKDNVYTWVFSQSNNKKNIYLKMNTEPKSNQEEKQDNKTVENNKKDKEENIWDHYAYIIIPVIIIAFLLFVMIISKVSRFKYEK